ncbi:YdcF family protein [Desulfosporosinus sp. BG]|uniref:YdcF family protein n=1 Tax=Desulfosporosinus sp. BG TaxID=1633135 RepID=UPI000839F55D|nr:YdcF family protein [Desulfosporosinus sp. BG]ODA42331.1 Integral membrane protein [Desulfosporosinus sp. BG]
MRIKQILRGLLFYLGILGIIDTVLLLLFNGGVNLGTILPGAAGGLLLFSLLTKSFFQKLIPVGLTRPWFLKIRQCVISLVLIGLISFLVVEGAIIRDSRPDPVVEVNYLIILGAGLNGEQLSWTLWERMQKGLEFLERYPQVQVVLSGGQGPGEKISEAEGMRRFLLDHGISDERILKEDQSTSTMENFRFSKEILIRQPNFQNLERVAVITNDFHLFRSKMLAQRNGLNPVGIPSPTPWYIVPNVYLREYFAVVKSLIFDW